MVATVSIKKFGRITTGAVDYDRLDKSLNDIVDTINTNAEELSALNNQQTYTIIRAYETPGTHILINGGAHGKANVVDAWLQIGDNAELSDIVKIINITDTVDIKDNEKSGKIKIFTVKKKMLNFYETVYIQKTTNKRILVGVTIENEKED